MVKPSFLEYLRFLSDPFFRWWWVALTGFASLLGLLMTPEQGIQVSRLGMFVLIFVGFTGAFLVMAVVARGWNLFALGAPTAYVYRIQRQRDGHREWVFLFRGRMSVEYGDLVDVHRRMGDSEVPFALVEIEKRTAAGDFQGRPVSMAPGHIRDFTAGVFSENDLVVSLRMRTERIRDSLDDLAAR